MLIKFTDQDIFPNSVLQRYYKLFLDVSQLFPSETNVPYGKNCVGTPTRQMSAIIFLIIKINIEDRSLLAK